MDKPLWHELWRMKGSYNVYELAALICDLKPNEFKAAPDNEERFCDDAPPELNVAIEIIIRDAEEQTLPCSTSGYPIGKSDQSRMLASLHWTEITDADAVEWLKLKRGRKPDYFFHRTETGSADLESEMTFRDPAHPRYSPQLACAVAAWENVTQPAPSKTPKQTMVDWITENCGRFSVDGSEAFTPSAIERVAMVCNWIPVGGAPRTGRRRQRKT